jgi:hypothetical protein
MQENDLVDGVIKQSPLLLRDYSEKWITAILPRHKPDLSEGTMTTYRYNVNRIQALWGDLLLEDVTTLHLSEGLEDLTVSQILSYRSRLVAIFDSAIADGLLEYNPAEKTRTAAFKAKRKRMTQEAFDAIRAEAKPWMQNLMDLALLTLQRIGDLLEARIDQLHDGVFDVIQQKTLRYDTGYLRIGLTDEMNEVLARCRDSLLSPHIVHCRPRRRDPRKKGHWTRIDYNTASAEFNRARDACGLFDDWEDGTPPTFHEIRALGIKRYKDQGFDPQQLAGHANPKQTKNYDSRHEEIRWMEVKLG